MACDMFLQRKVSVFESLHLLDLLYLSTKLCAIGVQVALKGLLLIWAVSRSRR